MSDEKRYLSEVEKIQLNPDKKKKVAKFLAGTDRFMDVREFMERSIDVFLAWEQNPQTSIAAMAQMDPTMAQYQVLSKMMKPEQLKDMYKGIDWAEEWGSKWIEFQKDNLLPQDPNTDESQKQMKARKMKGDFEEIQKNIQESNEFIENIEFGDVTDNNLNQTEYDDWPMISPTYSRFFPAKIAVVTLANMMREKETPLIDFEDFKINAHDIAEEIARKLIKYETDNKKKRSEKKSTGLPKPYDSDEITASQSIREERYKNKYFGKITKREGADVTHLDGLLSALGLVKVFSKDKVAKITLTKSGKDFCVLNNPVFEGKDGESLSKDEGEFLSTKCIPQRQLQFKTNKKVIKLVAETEYGKASDMANELDEICIESIKEFLKENISKKFENRIKTEILDKSITMDKENKKIRATYDNTDDLKERAKLRKDIKQTPIEALRIAVMGRMAELGIVHWHINVKGRSEYTIKNKELSELIINS